jgi:hypothetical protein
MEQVELILVLTVEVVVEVLEEEMPQGTQLLLPFQLLHGLHLVYMAVVERVQMWVLK